MPNGNDQISFSCVQCGSKDFIFPNQPPNDDDIISCNGCKREIGSYADIREATTKAAKAEMDKMVSNAFGKPIKLDWK